MSKEKKDRHPHSSSSDSESESEPSFNPLKNDDTDGWTESLFEQLEDEKGLNRGADILEAIREGGDLYAVRVGGDFDGCYPIHIAVRNQGYGNVAVSDILKSFSDPEERKKYMLLEDGGGDCLLDDLFTKNGDGVFDLDDIKSVFSYLQPEEQLSFIEIILKKHPNLLSEDDYGLESVQEFFDEINGGEYVEVCEQRRTEEAAVEAGYDSGEEGLGVLDEVQQNKTFTARVSYKKVRDDSGKIKSIPTLNLIPSSWRLETATSDSNQGDHVIAYVLLLNSLSHCGGENIKTLPNLLFDTFCAILPDHKEYFTKEKSAIKKKIEERATIRKEAVSLLRQVCKKGEGYLGALEDNLRKVEIEEVARYLEKMADKFIGEVNLIEGESFSQSRKKGVTPFLSARMQALVDKSPDLSDAKFNPFKEIIKNAIGDYLNGKDKLIIGKDLTAIYDIIAAKVAQDKVLKPAKISSKGQIQDFLTNITPLKKYNEGHAIKEISKLSKDIKLAKEKKGDNGKNLIRVGKLCAQLFDYPKVNNPDRDDIRVLCEAIPRHIIIIFAAFSELRTLEPKEKGVIYGAFSEQILKLQLWEGHKIKDKGKDALLDKGTLHQMVLRYSDMNASFDFSMKPSSQYPKKDEDLLVRPRQKLVVSSGAPTTGVGKIVIKRVQSEPVVAVGKSS